MSATEQCDIIEHSVSPPLSDQSFADTLPADVVIGMSLRPTANDTNNGGKVCSP
ncbi:MULTISPECIES: hypothetical protein [Modicisalibacter]|uniref:hypothetical protein n=1 Tax=Modicisalibacter TaxID=574347 RepID=UPI001396C509|nr:MULTISPECIES: hypothetical protein [Halomonadaceae]MBZ9558604.1 hypothetical protein [Modicisalibacter sp. R2A 31.J]MBZ9575504.1 hypothetical protein [Modicisalibacter sp. MOD 31.J]